VELDRKALAEPPGSPISSYLFSSQPPIGRDYPYVTTFTGRPKAPFIWAVLRVVDTVALGAMGRYVPALTQRTKHRIKA
jgi:hypothetical protein